MDGQLQIYTGDGKGKTTCAIGLCIRALGSGKKVAFIQFDKGSGEEDYYSERRLLKKLPGLSLFCFGKQRMFPDRPFRFANSPPDLEEAKRGVQKVVEVLKSGDFDVVVCDEILSCLLTKLIQTPSVLEIISQFEKSGRRCELIMTGRSLPDEVRERADLITEMKMVKHYFNKGLPARAGIEY